MSVNLKFMQLPYFYEPFISSINTVMTLGEDTSRHCVQVLRMKAGGKLQLTDGKGNIYTATIINADKKHCGVRIEETNYKENQNTRKVCIAISLLKNMSRFEWFLEKAVEIGVQQIIPLLCERTEKQHYKMDRLQNIVVSAMLQSQQVWLPLLHQPTTFSEVINNSNLFNQKFIAHCIDDNRKITMNTISILDKTQILIGPEGDFTEKEIALALEHHYQPVSLGNTRLRTETAGVVASALLVHSPQ